MGFKLKVDVTSVTGNFTIFEQNKASIPLCIYKTILKHQEREIHQVF